MKNWPFPRQQTPRAWWITPLGLFGVAAAIVLVPIILMLLAFAGLFIWSMWSSGGVGVFVAAFTAVGIAVILLGAAVALVTR